MTKTLMLTLLLTSSCVTRPHISNKERCSVSFKFKKCICYEYSLMAAKRVGPATRYPLQACEDITGFHAEDWAKDISPWAHENIRAYNDSRD